MNLHVEVSDRMFPQKKKMLDCMKPNSSKTRFCAYV